MIYISIVLMIIMLTTNVLMFFALRKLTRLIKSELERNTVVMQNSLFASTKDITFLLQHILDRLPAPEPTEFHPDDPDNPVNLEKERIKKLIGK